MQESSSHACWSRPMHEHTPHTTLLGLHQLVDLALEPLIGPMGLRPATENYLTVGRADLEALATAGDPQAALVGIGSDGSAPALLVAEPALCSTLLAGMWRSNRNQGATLTQVERQILLQFLNDAIGHWRAAWAGEGINVLPRRIISNSLSMLRDQLVDGAWHVARTVVSDEQGSPVGVLLFCYPAELVPGLVREHERTRWRSRIARGLTEPELARLREKLATDLRHLVINAPVTYQTEIPLGFLNHLERGDVITFDAPLGHDLPVRVLDRELQAQLARCGSRFAVAVTAAGDEEQVPAGAAAGGDDAWGDGYEQPAADHAFDGHDNNTQQAW